MYPPSLATCLKQLKSFTPPEKEVALTLLPQPRTPKKAIQAECMLLDLEKKILEPLSSATKPKVRSLIKGTKEILTYAQLQEQELQVIQARRMEEIERKINKRKVVVRIGGLTIRDAQIKLAEKARKEQQALKKNQEREFKKLLAIEKKMVHSQGVGDRKTEKGRSERVKDLTQEGQEVPPELSYSCNR